MKKVVQMAVKMESDLRDSFHAAALAQHRPAAQLIRDFMRQYVADNCGPAPTVKGAKSVSLPVTQTQAH